MRYKDIRLPVRLRGIYDNKKTSVPGRLIMPDSRSDITLLVSSGLLGKHQNYFSYFGKMLGEDFNVYISEQRNLGLSPGKTLRRDLMQIDEQLRDRTETDNLVYVAHSMGNAIAKGSAEEYDTQIRGFYGICAYPSLSHAFASSKYPDERSLAQRLMEVISIDDFGPLVRIDSKHKVPARFAIGDNDHVIRTYDTDVLARFISHFEGSGAQTKVFHGKNHCFNHMPFDLIPFNRVQPELLVDDIRKFVYSLSD